MYLLLFVLWLLLNGTATAETLAIGLLLDAMLGCILFALFGYTPVRDLRFLRKTPLFLVYVFVLIWEILKANYCVIGIVLHPEHKVEQGIVLFDSGLRTRFARFVLANSITLTPGTITVRAEKSLFTVHCLDTAMMDGFCDGKLVALLRKLEA